MWSWIEQLLQGQRGWVLFDADRIMLLHYKNIRATLHLNYNTSHDFDTPYTELFDCIISNCDRPSEINDNPAYFVAERDPAMSCIKAQGSHDQTSICTCAAYTKCAGSVNFFGPRA